MKLNPDCIRAILFAVEGATEWKRIFICSISDEVDEILYGGRSKTPNKLSYPMLADYTNDEIAYHFRQCLFSEFFINGECTNILKATDLSPAGHAFISNIESDNVWSDVKSLAGKIGTSSLKSLVHIADNVVATLIKAHFNIP